MDFNTKQFHKTQDKMHKTISRKMENASKLDGREREVLPLKSCQKFSEEGEGVLSKQRPLLGRIYNAARYMERIPYRTFVS